MQEANLYRLAFLFAGLAMNGTFLVVKRRQRVVRPIIIVNRALPRGNKTGTTHRITGACTASALRQRVRHPLPEGRERSTRASV